MSDAASESKQNKCVDFDPILPEAGLLFYEECPLEFEIDRPKLLPLKSTTQLRFEQLQYEAAKIWADKQKEQKKSNWFN